MCKRFLLFNLYVTSRAVMEKDALSAQPRRIRLASICTNHVCLRKEIWQEQGSLSAYFLKEHREFLCCR